jgi:hypothetical protein
MNTSGNVNTQGQWRFGANFVKVGNSSTYNSDDGSWGSRFVVASTVHARIDCAQDANAVRASWYTHTGQLYSTFGTVTSHAMYLMSHNSIRQKLENGYSKEEGSYRAPIFYDSGNTAYYGDFANTGIALNVAGRIQTSSTGLASAPSLEINNPSSSAFIHSAEILGANMTSGQTNIVVIGKEGTTKQAGYIGYNWTANNSNNNFVSIGHWSADHLLRVYGDVITTTVGIRCDADVRGTIFYDSNDTSYYLNPNATSVLNAVTFNGDIQAPGIYVGSSNTSFDFYNNGTSYFNGVSTFDDIIKVPSASHFIHMGDGLSTTSQIKFGSTSWNNSLGLESFYMVLRTNRNEGVKFIDSDGYTYAQFNASNNSAGAYNTILTGNLYAYALYDQNNTAYYLNPNGASTSLSTSGKWVCQGGHSSARLQLNYAHGSDAANSGTLTGWVSEPGMTYNSAGIGGNIHVNGQYYGRAYNSGYGCYVRFNKGNGSVEHWETTGNSGVSGGQGTMRWYSDRLGNSFATSSSRAPIFYDSQSTGYYLNPNDKSNLYSIKLNGFLTGTSAGCAEIGRNHAYDTMELKGYGAEFMIGAQSTQIHINYRTCNNGASGHTPTDWYWRAGSASSFANLHMGMMSATTQARAPIFYDSSDTTYYVDPASTSTSAKLRQFVVIGDSSTYNSNDGGWGARLVVSDNVHARIDVAQDANAMRSTWYAHTGHSYSFFGTITGHHQYLFSHNVLRQKLENGYSQETASYRAPIFYDSNNTTYYIDPESSGTSLNMAGKGVFGGDVIAYSDKKLKTNIKTLDGTKVLKMRGVSFDRIDSNKKSSGVIAQELQKIAPELITESNGTLGVAYGNLAGYLIEAIKEQQKTIEQLKDRINKLEK